MGTEWKCDRKGQQSVLGTSLLVGQVGIELQDFGRTLPLGWEDPFLVLNYLQSLFCSAVHQGLAGGVPGLPA